MRADSPQPFSAAGSLSPVRGGSPGADSPPGVRIVVRRGNTSVGEHHLAYGGRRLT